MVSTMRVEVNPIAWLDYAHVALHRWVRKRAPFVSKEVGSGAL